MKMRGQSSRLMRSQRRSPWPAMPARCSSARARRATDRTAHGRGRVAEDEIFDALRRPAQLADRDGDGVTRLRQTMPHILSPFSRPARSVRTGFLVPLAGEPNRGRARQQQKVGRWRRDIGHGQQDRHDANRSGLSSRSPPALAAAAHIRRHPALVRSTSSYGGCAGRWRRLGGGPALTAPRLDPERRVERDLHRRELKSQVEPVLGGALEIVDDKPVPRLHEDDAPAMAN